MWRSLNNISKNRLDNGFRTKTGNIENIIKCSGLRRNELVNLKIKDIIINNNNVVGILVSKGAKGKKRRKVQIRKEFQHLIYKLIENLDDSSYVITEKTPKTKNSFRTVPIPTNITKNLFNYKKEQDIHISLVEDEYNNKDYVFYDKLGKPIDDKRPGRNLKSILSSIDIEPIKFHALRHTYATRLFELGVPLKTVQHLMGYADIETTMNIYTKVMPEQKLKAVDKINILFK